MVRELAEDLAAAGHEVTVLTGWPNHPGGKLFPGFQQRWRQVQADGRHRLMRVGHFIGSKKSPLVRLWMYATFAVSSFLNALTLGRQDAVVCLSTPIFGVWTAWLLARLWRGRFVNVVFDLWPEAILNAGLTGDNAVYRMLRRADTRLGHLSDVITTLGEGMRDQILARGIDGGKVKVIPFWIDTQRISPLERDNSWRRRQGIGPEKFVAMFAGTVGYASGAQMLVETARRLSGRDDILLLVVGEGQVKDILQADAEREGLANLKFLPFQDESELAEMQAAGDAGLVTLLPNSGVSSVPSKVLGYMAAGRAVIASAPAGSDTAQLIDQARCGIAVPAQDASALAGAIRALADDRARCQSLGRNARDFAVAHLSRGAVVRQYQEIILGLCNP
jgi:colanic acid biosynthesis glycosyl transferase WcaI